MTDACFCQCVFRGDARFFLSEMPSGQEIFDHDFFLVSSQSLSALVVYV